MREAKGLSQYEVAEATGILQPNLSAIENGQVIPKVETIGRLCAFYGCKAEIDANGSIALI